MKRVPFCRWQKTTKLLYTGFSRIIFLKDERPKNTHTHIHLKKLSKADFFSARKYITKIGRNKILQFVPVVKQIK